jgi:hypothetical protein
MGYTFFCLVSKIKSAKKKRPPMILLQGFFAERVKKFRKKNWGCIKKNPHTAKVGYE